MAKFRAPFPKYIDKTRMVGPFEIDEAAFIIVSVGASLVIGFALGINVALALGGGIIGGLMMAVGIKAIKRNFAEGYIYHLMYKKGLRHPMYDNPSVRLKHPSYIKNQIKIIPNGFIKTLVE